MRPCLDRPTRNKSQLYYRYLEKAIFRAAPTPPARGNYVYDRESSRSEISGILMSSPPSQEPRRGRYYSPMPHEHTRTQPVSTRGRSRSDLYSYSEEPGTVFKAAPTPPARGYYADESPEIYEISDEPPLPIRSQSQRQLHLRYYRKESTIPTVAPTPPARGHYQNNPLVFTSMTRRIDFQNQVPGSGQ